MSRPSRVNRLPNYQDTINCFSQFFPKKKLLKQWNEQVQIKRLDERYEGTLLNE